MTAPRTHYAAGGRWIESQAAYVKTFTLGRAWCNVRVGGDGIDLEELKILQIGYVLPILTLDPEKVTCQNCMRVMGKWWKKIED